MKYLIWEMPVVRLYFFSAKCNQEKVCNCFKSMMYLTLLFCCNICKAKREIILWRLESLCYLCKAEHFFHGSIWIYFKKKIIWILAGSSPPQRPSSESILDLFFLKYRWSYLRCWGSVRNFIFCLVRNTRGDSIMGWLWLFNPLEQFVKKGVC